MPTSIDLESRLILVWLLTLFFTSLFCTVTRGVEDVDAVSSFYGPGAYLSWLIVALKTLMTGELQELIFMMFPRFRPTQNKKHSDKETTEETRRLEVTPELAAIWMYWFITVVDYSVRKYVSKSLSQAQAEAALHIIRPTSLLGAILIFSRRLGNLKSSGARFLGWSAILFVSCMSLLLSLASKDQPISLVDPICGYFANLATNDFPPVDKATGTWNLLHLIVHGFSWLASPAVLIGTIYMGRKNGFEVRCGLPRTGSKLTDLDQAAALFATICFTLHEPAKMVMARLGRSSKQAT